MTATDSVSAFVVGVLLDLTGVHLADVDLQFVRRATSVASAALAGYRDM